MRVHGFRGWIASGLVTAALAGCDSTPSSSKDSGFELVGRWSSGFDDEAITETRWDSFCLQAVRRYSNLDNVAILETTGGEGCTTGFGRVIWTDIVDDSFNYCTTAFGEPTADDASKAPATAVSDDLASGCGGFPWSHLTRKP